MADERTSNLRRIDVIRGRVDTGRDWLERTLVWRVWERMLEIEFVDRSVALAGKAFVSFFPLVIVVAAFLPQSIRDSIFTSLTHRLGIRGDALATTKEAFTTADDVRKATGILGLVLTIFFASSFTTALQRVFMRAWRRPPGGKVGAYTRGPAWLVVVLLSMAFLGAFARTARQRSRHRVVRRPVAGDHVLLVVVHRMVPAPRRSAVARARFPPA